MAAEFLPQRPALLASSSSPRHASTTDRTVLGDLGVMQAQREVQAIYSKALERADEEAVQRLEGLVGQKHGGAACLALAKVTWMEAGAARVPLSETQHFLESAAC